MPALTPRTLCAAFDDMVQSRAGSVALRTPDGAQQLTWAEVSEQARRLAGGLASRGIARGETVALMTGNRPEFFLADMATLIAGGTPMSIYQTSPVDEIAYLLDDAAAKVVVTEERFEPVLREAVAQAQVDPYFVVLGPEGAAGLRPLLDACPAGYDAEAAGRAVELDDIAVIIYTSGTTGPPKGVQLTHRNLSAMWRAARSLDPRIDHLERVISYLPTAHLADRLWAYVGPLWTGACVTYVVDPKQVVSAMIQTRPSFFLGVPRMWEKLRVALQAAVPEGRRANEPELAATLRDRIGMDEGSIAFTGAAPLDGEILDFFESIGIELLEGYGMTETSGVISSTRATHRREGTVGIPFDGVEVTIADDGEILVRGDDVLMLGYRNKPEQTAETIGEDGWLRTGDVGSIDEDGFLTILDRKKEIIVTAGGKNLSPANVENAIRSATHLAGPVIAVGDGRAYVTALISLDPDESKAWATAQGLEDATPAQLAGDPRLRQVIADAIEEANRHLARPSQVKHFTIVPETWDAASGLVTPTLKLKRKAVTEAYADAIEDLYAAG